MKKVLWIIGMMALVMAVCGSVRGQAKEIYSDEIFRPTYLPQENVEAITQAVAEEIGLADRSAEGVKIALIDSGIDPGCAALQNKAALYRDYTDEGKMSTKNILCHNKRSVAYEGKVYYIKGLSSSTQALRIGKLPLHTWLDEAQDRAVLAVQAEDGWQIYLDCNGDRDFTDETALRLYKPNGAWASVPVENGTLNLIISGMDHNAENLQFSADFLGHGSFIGSLIAGECANYHGLATGSQLCVYKIFNKEGKAKQEALVQALNDAIKDKVQIVNLSLSLPLKEEASEALCQTIQKAQEKGILIVAATGNYGAGRNTIAFPATAPGVIGVGAVITPLVYQYGWGVCCEKPFIPSYSARGDAQCAPSMVAPGAIAAAVPQWYDAEYMFDEGTSIAAGVTTATIAHLLADQIEAKQVMPYLLDLAEDLGEEHAAQGAGEISLKHFDAAAVEKTLHTNNDISMKWEAETDTLYVTNTDQNGHTVEITSDRAWLRLPKQIWIAPNETIRVAYHIAETLQNAQSAFLRAKIDKAQTATSFAIAEKIVPITLGVPYEAAFSLSAGEGKNYYLFAAPNEQTWEIVVEMAEDEQGNAAGRCFLEIYDPNGALYSRSDFFGAGTEQHEARAYIEPLTVGTWQVRVVCGEWLSIYQRMHSEGTIRLQRSTAEKEG